MECDKKSYSSKSDAMSEVIGLQHRVKKHKFPPYTCKECGKWHITTITKKDLPTLREKYPVKFDRPLRKEKEPKKKSSYTPPATQIKSDYPFMTKDQAEALKRIVENGKPE